MSTGSSGQRGSSPPPGPKKSVDELKKERQEAQEQLEELLHTGRPRNLGEGVVNGVSTIVAGAVGAAGIAVMAPAMGLVAGTSAGGIVGGAVGVAFGAVVGIVGGAAIAVTSAISGVVHIGRGVVAVPSSLSKPTQGYWWNESTHSWIYTDMTKESTKLLDIPDDDSDILRKYEDEIDGTSSTTGTAGDVVDPYYYECLEVPTNADPSLIKRRYYILARQYHPDKVGTDDKESAEKFKEVAEAYQVLIDPELRKKYDKDGRAGLSPDKTSVADDNRFSNIDPALLFAFLFGSDKFHAYVGRLSTATSSSIGDSPKVTMKEARTIQERRVTRMALYLIDKISPWVAVTMEQSEVGPNPVRDDIEAAWEQEAIELCTASYGYQMVSTIGKVYNLVGIVYDGSLDSGQGLPGLSKWAKRHKAGMDSKRVKTQTKFDTLKLGMDMMKLQEQTKEKLASAKTDEEREQIATDFQDAKTSLIVRVLWTTAVVDIAAAIHEATQMVFFDQSVDKRTRKYRGKAIQKLGEIWMNTPDLSIHDDPTSENSTKKNEKQLMEEAAFAAMVETVKRKDEASHAATTTTEV